MNAEISHQSQGVICHPWYEIETSDYYLLQRNGLQVCVVDSNFSHLLLYLQIMCAKGKLLIK